MKVLSTIVVVAGLFGGSLAHATTPVQYRVDKDARIVDLGPAPDGEARAITLSLKVVNQAAMEAQAASTVDPGSPNFHKFLTPEQVGALYGQNSTTITQIVNFLAAQGIVVTKVFPNNLTITARGTNAQLAAAFGSPIHVFQGLGATYEAPVGATAVPTQLAAAVAGVHGLSQRPLLHSNALQQPLSGVSTGESSRIATVTPTPNAAATALPGQYTTADLAIQYNITPLHAAGLSGAGKTIGIVTLAGYFHSDPFTYWQALGLNVDPGRITDVNVDGGPLDGAFSDGAIETTLDIEQSGGIAPGARMRVYLGPNSGTGFLDSFAQAVNENLVDTLSVSWGSPEIYSDLAELNAFHAIFLQAALQGIPVIAASGDSGAFDINRGYAYPACTTLLSTDFPASDPLVLAAGGTTLPFVQQRLHGTISVPAERAWAWDYLRNYIVQNYGQTLYYTDYFPIGGGGGVSVDFGRPGYQNGIAGIMNSASAQSLYCKASVFTPGATGYLDLVDMPAGVAGRNVPDVSLNADPFTGYLIAYGGTFYMGGGGTSFVSPQLNGIFTLIAQGAGGRLGLLQPQLYNAFKAKGYGAGSPFRPITTGTDLYYQSSAKFNPATGLGSLDAANLARAFGVTF